VRVAPRLLGLALGLAAAACHRAPHPWEGAADAGAHALGENPLASAPSPAAADAGDARPTLEAGTDAPDAGDARLPHPTVRVGGPWVRCYGHFRVSGEPVKDVTRLALLCGPENGMTRLSAAPLEGSVTEGGAPVTQPLELARGVCYRVFATATPSVTDLDVVVRSSRGAAIAADHGEDAWPVVQPDRPFCALEDDHATVEVTAKRGSGRFALEVWHLHPAPPVAPEEAARRRAAGAAP
jgi:hypothetical protein